MRTTGFIVASTAILFSAAMVHGRDPAGHGKNTPEFSLFPQADMQFKDGPPSLPKGAQIAVLEGDPTKEGPFVFRVKLPDGYRIPPHTHPKMERVTVISGSFNIGMGATFDPHATREMTAGTYGFWAPNMAHFVRVKGETVAQFHGIGPWSIEYVDPADDPRNQKAP
jgi:quercetin dioxygenase-like cupin family protein